MSSIFVDPYILKYKATHADDDYVSIKIDETMADDEWNRFCICYCVILFGIVLL